MQRKNRPIPDAPTSLHEHRTITTPPPRVLPPLIPSHTTPFANASPPTELLTDPFGHAARARSYGYSGTNEVDQTHGRAR